MIRAYVVNVRDNVVQCQRKGGTEKMRYYTVSFDSLYRLRSWACQNKRLSVDITPLTFGWRLSVWS